MGSDMVTWPPPRDPGGDLVRYDIRIRQNGTDVTTIAVPGTATSFDFASLSLAPGVYEFEVHTCSYKFEWLLVHICIHLHEGYIHTFNA